MPHFIIVLILYINLLNLSWIKNVYFFRNMVPLRHMRTAKVRSDCASAQSDQDLHCPLTESLGTKYMCIAKFLIRLYISDS